MKPQGPLSIVRVEAHALRAVLNKPQRTSQGDYAALEIVVVEIETADGTIGFGECLARRGSKAYAAFIGQVFAPLLIGQDARDRRRLWMSMRSVLTGRTGGMLIEAIAGVDIALWDIAGKHLKQPIHKLLGGIGRTEVAAYASSINWLADDIAEAEIRRAVAFGFKRIKVKLGRPLPDAIARVKLARRVAGDSIELVVDANWCYDVDEAVTVGRALADLGYLWFEEPIRPEDSAGYALLRDKLEIKLAAGESDFTVDDAAPLISQRLVGVIQPDVARAGGISETWRIAELAAAFGVAYAPHVGWSGAICAAASLQLAASSPNFLTFECMVYDNPLRQDLVVERVGEAEMLRNGSLPVPQGPGLGITVNRDVLNSLRAT
jgi:D-galactarolactone cycloisomerase